jgi:hypothetical protein
MNGGRLWLVTIPRSSSSENLPAGAEYALTMNGPPRSSGDPAQDGVDSRFVVSLTVTTKLGDLSIPFGIVYDNKEKFLTGVDTDCLPTSA